MTTFSLAGVDLKLNEPDCKIYLYYTPMYGGELKRDLYFCYSEDRVRLNTNTLEMDEWFYLTRENYQSRQYTHISKAHTINSFPDALSYSPTNEEVIDAFKELLEC